MSNHTTLEAIEQEMERLQAQYRAQVLVQIRWLMNKHDITIDELAEKRAPVKVTQKAKAKAKPAAKKTKAKAKPVQVTGDKRRNRGPQPPKYRNPETGETWSGMARAPAWIKDVENRDQFLIQ
jgi:DNA-binding protein H-NS